MIKVAVCGANGRMGKEVCQAVLNDNMTELTAKIDIAGDDVYSSIEQAHKEKEIDLLVIHDTGAHGFAMGYSYNGKLKSAELLLKENGEVQLIRRAETPKDYFSTFDCTDFYSKLKF